MGNVLLVSEMIPKFRIFFEKIKNPKNDPKNAENDAKNAKNDPKNAKNDPMNAKNDPKNAKNDPKNDPKNFFQKKLRIFFEEI